jgi:hypothetical protein
VPVKLTGAKDSSGTVKLLAGFFGVSQRESDFALSPAISWAVGTPAQKAQATAASVANQGS